MHHFKQPLFVQGQLEAQPGPKPHSEVDVYGRRSKQRLLNSIQQEGEDGMEC
jgi:hypothetical protein